MSIAIGQVNRKHERKFRIPKKRKGRIPKGHKTLTSMWGERDELFDDVRERTGTEDLGFLADMGF